MKFIIVDDNNAIIFLFTEILKELGHEVVATASNGKIAIKLIEENQIYFDIILMDNRMPVMDGLTATKEILKINPKNKIIFLSADYSIRDKALEIGALDFIEKPIDFNQFSDRLAKYT